MTALWQAVDQYLAERAPKDWAKAEVRRYRQRIHEILSAEFRLLSFFQSGSFQHGTAVMPHSDVDYMARIHYEDKPLSSTTILEKMRYILKAKLWEANSVAVDRPTVTLRFTGIVTNYEITPAYLLRGNSDEKRVVAIPASGGGWREAAPQAHNKFVAKMDSNHLGNVRKIARLLKAWKYEHGVPISSFYLEMRCAEYGKNNDSIWALSALRAIVGRMISTELAAMNDPTQLVSRITAYSSESSRLTAMARLRTLKKNLDTAESSWLSGESRRWEMNQALQAIWGGGFPYCETSS
ncbi:nucleotidyltransferase domain-containing protein [Embleya scabrispora]|uniref:nucleotidyltransferase domain-containing protein n=1 Tax=Embleya scabrispora TaxID=159449 RepID=UPI00117E3935|nr:nucleotidyltransferase [Embleya scabrispora]